MPATRRRDRRIVGQRRREQRDREQLGGVRLGRGDRPFRAGLERDHLAGGRGQRRGGVVGDGDGRGALGAGRRDDADDVRRGARLADPDDQRVGESGATP